LRRSLLYTFFRLGRVPGKTLPALEAEGVVLLDEGLRASVTLRDYRAPGRFHGRKRSIFAGSLVLTGQRFAAFAFSKPLFNVPLHDGRFRALEMWVPRDDVLHVGFDPADFDTRTSGSVECRFHTENARSYLERIASDS
jgi:hypothetical protein